MAKLWNRFLASWNSWNSWNPSLPKDEQNSWQTYYGEEVDYSWVKRLLASVAIFLVVYGAHASDTALGRETVNVVRKVLTTQTDYAYWINKGKDYGSRYFPNALNWSAIPLFNEVKTTISKPADPLLYMSKPVEGKLKTTYGWYSDPLLKQEIFHEGIDILIPVGTSVRAAAPGKVKLIGDRGVLGKMLIMEHGQDIETVYGYLGEVLVKDNELVSQGQVIARVGKVKKSNQTASSDEPALYFEVRQNGKAIDPLTRIRGEFPK